MTTGPIPETIKFRRKLTYRSLTKRVVSALEAPCEVGGKPQQTWTYDAKTPRLAICVWSSGSKVWYWVGRHAGRMIRMKIGTYPEVTPEQARKLAARVSADVSAGTDPRAERQQARGKLTLRELFDAYLEGHAKVHRKTWAEDQAQYDRYLKHWGGRKLSAIGQAEVRALHGKLGRDHGQYAANRVLALVFSMFGYAASNGYGTAVNPCRGVKRFREHSRDRFLQGDELQRFLVALEQESPMMRDYFKLALLTGARRGNLQAMRWDQLHLDRGEWRVPDTKAGEPQVVYLPAEAVEILRRRQDESTCDYVFPSRIGSKRPHLTFQYRAWRKTCERAGLDNLRPHDLRRSLGSWQAATGASLPVIGKTLEHKNQSTTAIYARLNLDPVRESVDRAVQAMLRAANGGKEVGQR